MIFLKFQVIATAIHWPQDDKKEVPYPLCVWNCLRSFRNLRFSASYTSGGLFKSWAISVESTFHWYTMLYTNHTQKHALDQGHLRHCGVGHTGLVPRRTSHFRTLSRALCGETKRHQEVADSKSKKNWITQPYVARLSFLWTRINTHTN